MEKIRNTKYTTEEFIEKAMNVHGDKYDYSKVNYVNNSTKVCIICPEHGEFWQMPGSHLNGNGCPSCVNVKKLTKDDFVNRANIVHNNKYDYTLSNFHGIHHKIIITCPIHGNFEQLAKNHLRGQGCPECGKKYAKEFRKKDYKSFIKESENRFGGIFEFPNIENEYINSHSKIHIKCKTCGNTFMKIACDHLTSPHGGCLNCYVGKSVAEEEIANYIKNDLKLNIVCHDRYILHGQELDIYCPNQKIAIEYNGLYWHSEECNKDKNYHLNKLIQCNKNGIKLIQIFEDEYIQHKDIVLNKIKHLFNIQEKSPKIMGRKCVIKEIKKNDAEIFLNKYHIQGFASSTVYLCAFYNDELVAVMTFKEEVKNSGKWELNRFASNYNYICQGVGGKLFKYFINNYNPIEIKSFADRRWTINEINNVYLKLGFKFMCYTYPEYRYFIQKDGLIRQHKFNFRKQTLHKKYGFPLTMTESEMAKKLKISKIWDCGLIKYVWKNE